MYFSTDMVTARDLRDHDKDMDAHKTSLQANATPTNKRVYAGTTPPSETDRRIWKNSASSGIWASLIGHLFVRPQDNYLYDITNGKWYNNDAEEIPNPGITLGVSAPLVYSLTSDIQEVTGSDPVTFSCVASDPDGVVVKYEWDFGDGAVVQTVENTTTHSYGLDGTYTPKVRVQDNSGLWSSWVTHNTGGVTVIEVELGSYFGDRGLFMGGGVSTSGYTGTNTITYINILSPGSSVDFGDLTARKAEGTAMSNGIYGIYYGGYSTPGKSGGVMYNTIDYVTIASLGNASNWGSSTLSSLRGRSAGGSNSQRGVSAGDVSIDYLTLLLGSNANNFGNLLQSTGSLVFNNNNTTGIFSNGGTNLRGMEYITIMTESNSIYFGSLTYSYESRAGCSGEDRGLIAGGKAGSEPYVEYDAIEYINITTPSNSSIFGTLSNKRYRIAGTSNNTTGIFGGGRIDFTSQSRIDSITIATLGNSTAVGNLTVAIKGPTATSGSPN